VSWVLDSGQDLGLWNERLEFCWMCLIVCDADGQLEKLGEVRLGIGREHSLLCLGQGQSC
jgi:hypothetical protein